MKKIIRYLKFKVKNMRIYLGNFRNKQNYHKISILNKIKMKMKGYRPDHYVQYDFKNNKSKEYLTEVDRWKTRRVNGNYNFLLDNDLAFYYIFKEHVEIPPIYGWINKGLFYSLKNNQKSNNKEMVDIIIKQKKVILKPIGGGGGKGIITIEHIQSETFYYSGIEILEQDLITKILSLKNYTMSKFIDQDKYSNKIFERTINTIRIITIIDENGDVDIPVSLHRFGTSKTVPVDNVSSGGLFSNIDVETGILSEAKSYRTSKIYERHPDSNELIKGIKIENWEDIKHRVKKVALKFPFIPFMAWDIVPNKNGFYVLEINASTGLTFIQMFGPLRNTKLGKFYKEKGVIK